MYGLGRYGDYGYGEEANISRERDFFKDLMPYFPSIYQKENFKKLMDVFGQVIGDEDKIATELGKQRVLDSVTWGIYFWENEFGLDNSQFDIKQRREMIRARLKGRSKTTLQVLKDIAEGFTGSKVELVEHYGEFKVTIKFIDTVGIPKGIKELSDMINLIKPSHLAYDFEYNYTTCQMLINWKVKCDDLIKEKITCDGLKIYRRGD